MIKWTKPSPSVFAYFKQSKLEGRKAWEWGVGTLSRATKLFIFLQRWVHVLISRLAADIMTYEYWCEILYCTLVRVSFMWLMHPVKLIWNPFLKWSQNLISRDLTAVAVLSKAQVTIIPTMLEGGNTYEWNINIVTLLLRTHYIHQPCIFLVLRYSNCNYIHINLPFVGKNPTTWCLLHYQDLNWRKW